MPQAVVDGLELVEINHQHRVVQLRPPPGTLQGTLQSLTEKGAIGQASEGIVKGLVGDLVLERFALGDILIDIDDAIDRLANPDGKTNHIDRDERAITMAALGFALHGFTIEDGVTQFFTLHQ